MIVPILLVAGAGAGLVTLLLSHRTVGAATPAQPGNPLARTNQTSNRADSRVVMGKIALKPGPDAAKTDALDKVNCADLVVAATNAAGLVVAKAPARAGASKGECIYSLKVPAGADLKLGVQNVTLHSSVMMRKAGGEQILVHDKWAAVSNAHVMQKGAQVGNERPIIIAGGLSAAGTGEWVKGTDLLAHKGVNQIGPLQRNLNAIFIFEASKPLNK